MISFRIFATIKKNTVMHKHIYIYKCLKLILTFFTFSMAVLGGLTVNSCANKTRTGKNTIRSVYYWATQLDLDSTKRDFLARHGIRRMYIRYFDVVADESGEATPNATIRFRSPLPEKIEVVPTVFVLPECLHGDRKKLARRIVDRVLQMDETNDIKNVREIQIDCDWTSSTRQTYNMFMAEMLKICHAHDMKLSSTIRLHQLAQTPPPADRGVLMMYNTGNVADINCRKPILDMRDAAPYLSRLRTYKLPLSTAYPVFSWRVLFRGGQFVGIMHSDDEYPRLPSDSVCAREPSLDDITEAIRAVEKRRSDANDETIIFDLNKNNLKRFNTDDYEKIFHRGLSAGRISCR